ncbi:hypothetical protein B0H11DRAFT_127198 [Mycena galericulata]|nr:hypothetical protein B0H11DRAFT_127198 [Mycena galericulata]
MPPNITTRPSSRSVITAKATTTFPTHPLCVFEMPPVLISGPDADFQSNSLPVLRTAPKLIGLGLGSIDTAVQSRLSRPPKAASFSKHSASAVPLDTRRPRIARKGSSFDYERSMSSLKIKEESILSDPALVSPISAKENPSSTSEFNSLYDLDVQYPSSRSLNAPSPDSALNYSYSPSKLSPSWSLESMFTSAFSTPEDGIPSSSNNIRFFPASFSSSSKVSLLGSPIVAESRFTQSPFTARTLHMTPPLADINVFRAFASSPDSSSSVDPAYITAPLNYPNLSLAGQHASTSDEDVFGSPGFGHRNGFTRSLMFKVESPEKPQLYGVYRSTQTPLAPCCPTLPPPSGILTNLAPRPRIIKRKSSTHGGSCKREQVCSGIPGTPILDAHRGITQADLEDKARRYKERNPELEDFDSRWLASFSGKLSDQGEMIEHFRCYVVGCTQMNKRRDHMIIHVGSHLNQRQFKCLKCPSRFLRKNELKRHGRSHDSSRPFLCPERECNIAFRRQDLLIRHLRNIHLTQPETDQENERPSKRAKTCKRTTQ